MDDVALVDPISYAMATAAASLSLAAGGRVLRVADEFPSLPCAFDGDDVARGLSALRRAIA